MEPSVINQTSLFNFYLGILATVIMVLFAIVCFFTVRTIRKIDTNQGLMFAQLGDLRKEVHTLQGEHNMAIKLGVHLNCEGNK